MEWSTRSIRSLLYFCIERRPRHRRAQLSFASAVPLTSVSVWDEFLVARHARPTFSLNYMNYDAAANLLLPRAVAYSAGLIDYFFRGKLEISLPDEGVYGVIDQSVESQPYTKGFRKIKLRLRNVTPPVVPTAGPQKDQSIAQDMSGTVLAVVKYHENACYQADLSGEFGSREIRTNFGDVEFNDPTAVPPGCRRTEEKITVSDPQPQVSLTAGAANTTSLTFTFANPVPINATDVYLQVVFRGVQGMEQDAVVVGTKDISEPTHFTLVNVTDYLVCYNDNWYYKNADGSLPASIPNQFAGALQAQPYSATRFAFGQNAGRIGGGVLSTPWSLSAIWRRASLRGLQFSPNQKLSSMMKSRATTRRSRHHTNFISRQAINFLYRAPTCQ